MACNLPLNPEKDKMGAAGTTRDNLEVSGRADLGTLIFW